MKPLLAMLLIASVARADTGYSYIGLCHPTWPCESSLKAFDDKIVVGWLENTFSKDCTCADRLLSLAKPKTVRIHILNSPCLRNGRCGHYEPFYGLSVAKANRMIARRDARLISRIETIMLRVAARLGKAVPPINCYVSPCLECDLGNEQRSFLHNLSRNLFPGCTLVDSPVRNRCLPGAVCERHGAMPKLKSPCIADLDGTDVATIDRHKYLAETRQCELQYIWKQQYNCYDGTRFIDPRKRVCRGKI